MHIFVRADLEAKLCSLAASEGRDLNDVLAEALDRYSKNIETPPGLWKSPGDEKPQEARVAVQQSPDDLDQYFGLWAKNGHPVDGLEYQKRIRSEW